MAIRPVFIPRLDAIGVEEKSIEFKWYPGYAVSQKQKSIQELHQSAEAFGCKKLLEISSKSPIELGVSLSAFNLKVVTKVKKQEFTVESAFQGSKVFQRGGPYLDIFMKSPRDAKRDVRLKESGNMTGFKFFNMEFPLIPRTYFYDWLYINALMKSPNLTKQIKEFSGFTDIEFNPKKSINCQAHAVALYLSIEHQGMTDRIKDPQSFLDLTSSHYKEQKRHLTVQDTLL